MPGDFSSLGELEAAIAATEVVPPPSTSGDGRTTPEWLRDAEATLHNKPAQPNEPRVSGEPHASNDAPSEADALPIETVRSAVRRLMLGAGEVIDSTSDEAFELLVALEHILGHGFKRKKTLLSLEAMNPDRTLWSFIAESLERFCEPAHKTIAYVRSANLHDDERVGVWLRLCLNEGCLHTMLETLANDMPAQQLRAWYQDHAFVRSDHMTVLLSLCAGLDAVNFQLPLHLPPDPPPTVMAGACSSDESFAAAVAALLVDRAILSSPQLERRFLRPRVGRRAGWRRW